MKDKNTIDQSTYAFIRDSYGALSTLSDTVEGEELESIIRAMCNDREIKGNILAYIAREGVPLNIFQIVAEEMLQQEKGWESLVDQIVILSQRQEWARHNDVVHVSEIPVENFLGKGAVFDYFVRKYRYLIKPDALWLSDVNPNSYWARCVRKHLVLRKDDKRAWETLKKAEYGLTRKPNSDDFGDRREVKLAASPETIKTLIGEIFELMVKKRRWGKVTNWHQLAVSSEYLQGKAVEGGKVKVFERVSTIVYELKKPSSDRLGRNRKRKAARMTYTRPGWKIAQLFSEEHGFGKVFSETGIKALLMGQYFANVRSEKRRKQFEKIQGLVS